MIGARATTLLFGLAGARLLGAHLSVEAVGLYSLAVAVGTFVATVSELGIRNVYVRDVAQNLEAGPELLAAFTIIKAVGAVALLPLAVVYIARQTGGWEGVAAGGAISLGLFANSVAIAWLSIARAHERFGWDALGQVVFSAVGVAAWLVILPAWPTAAAAGTGMLVAGVVQLVFTGLVVRIMYQVSLRKLMMGARLKECSHVIRRSWAYGVGALLVIVYFRIDAVMLEAFRGLRELGLYGAAYKLFEVGVSAPIAIAAVLLPGYARAVAAGPAAVASTYAQTLRRQCLVAGALGGLLIGFAPLVVRVVWTSRFDASAPSLVGLGVALTCDAIYSVNGSFLTALDRRRFIVWNALGAVAVNVITNLFAIPRWGAVGASWTTATTEAFLLVGSTVVMARAARTPLWELAAPVVATISLVVALAWWASLGPAWGVMIAGGAIGLGCAALTILAFVREESSRIAGAAADLPCV